MLDVSVIDDPTAAEVTLDPVRARLLAALAEPASASRITECCHSFASAATSRSATAIGVFSHAFAAASHANTRSSATFPPHAAGVSESFSQMSLPKRSTDAGAGKSAALAYPSESVRA